MAAANPPDERDPLDTVLLGVCTGSVACAAALKIQIKVFERERSKGPVPVMVVLSGSYHGMDMVAQSLRGIPAAAVLSSASPLPAGQADRRHSHRPLLGTAALLPWV